MHGWTGGTTAGSVVTIEHIAPLVMGTCSIVQIDQPTRDLHALARVALGVVEELADVDPVRTGQPQHPFAADRRAGLRIVQEEQHLGRKIALGDLRAHAPQQAVTQASRRLQQGLGALAQARGRITALEHEGEMSLA